MFYEGIRPSIIAIRLDYNYRTVLLSEHVVLHYYYLIYDVIIQS